MSSAQASYVCLLVSYQTLARCSSLDEPQTRATRLLSLGKRAGHLRDCQKRHKSVTCLAPRALPPVKAVL